MEIHPMKTIIINVQDVCPMHGRFIGDSCYQCELAYFRKQTIKPKIDWSTGAKINHEKLSEFLKRFTKEPEWFYEI